MNHNSLQKLKSSLFDYITVIYIPLSTGYLSSFAQLSAESLFLSFFFLRLINIIRQATALRQILVYSQQQKKKQQQQR